MEENQLFLTALAKLLSSPLVYTRHQARYCRCSDNLQCITVYNNIIFECQIVIKVYSENNHENINWCFVTHRNCYTCNHKNKKSQTEVPADFVNAFYKFP